MLLEGKNGRVQICLGAKLARVEAKVAESRVDPSLVYFRERLKLRSRYQVVLDGTRDFMESGVRSLPAGQFLVALV